MKGDCINVRSFGEEVVDTQCSLIILGTPAGASPGSYVAAFRVVEGGTEKKGRCQLIFEIDFRVVEGGVAGVRLRVRARRGGVSQIQELRIRIGRAHRSATEGIGTSCSYDLISVSRRIAAIHRG